MTSITGQLADFCAGLRTRSVPAAVHDHAAAVLLDWLGTALAGAASQSAALTRQLEPLLGGYAKLAWSGAPSGRRFAWPRSTTGRVHPSEKSRYACH